MEYSLPTQFDASGNTALVASYRGIENPFGHLWSWTDGCLALVQSNSAGAKSLFFTCDDPALFGSTSESLLSYRNRGELPRTEGYIKSILCGEQGENMPSETGNGASATTYFCDVLFTSVPTNGEEVRGLIFGGTANLGTNNGLASVAASRVPTDVSANVGSRLCFIPAK